MSSSSFVSNGGAGSSGSPGVRDGNNNFMNGDSMLKLALKKPKSWKWELTTSSSSASIDFPKIQLFDSRTGELMVQVDQPDRVVKSEELVNEGGNSDRSRSSGRYRRSRSSCVREKVVTSGEYLSDVFEQLQNKGMGYKLTTSASQYRLQEELANCPLQKSKSANEVGKCTNLEQNGGSKKKIRKSSSSRSSSILGRISEFYKSSTEEEPPAPTPAVPPPPPPPAVPEIQVVEEPKPASDPTKPKIYKLVRSNAGTLIVREESFHTQRSLRRRKQLEDGLSIPEDDPNIESYSNNLTLADIPASSYEHTINEIDALISKVMLSHTLQTVEEPPMEVPRGRKLPGSKDAAERKRRSRRSASVGSGGSRRSVSASRRERASVVPPGGSSSEEDLVSLAESRFGSLKRRGRAKNRRSNATNRVEGMAVDQARKQEEQESNVRPSPSQAAEKKQFSETISLLRAFASQSPPASNRSRSKSTSTSVSTLSPASPPAADEEQHMFDKSPGTATVDVCSSDHNSSVEVTEVSSRMSTTLARASIATLPEVRFERLISMEQTAQETEILKPCSSYGEEQLEPMSNGRQEVLERALSDQLASNSVESVSTADGVNVAKVHLEEKSCVDLVDLILCHQSSSKKEQNFSTTTSTSPVGDLTVEFQQPTTVVQEPSQTPTAIKRLDAADRPKRFPVLTGRSISDISEVREKTPQRSTVASVMHKTSRLDPENYFESYLAELRSITAQSSTSPSRPSDLLPLPTSHSTSSLAALRQQNSDSASSIHPPVRPQQRAYGRRHHRSSFLLPS